MICISLPVQPVLPFYSLPALSTNAARVMFRGRLCETARSQARQRDREREHHHHHHHQQQQQQQQAQEPATSNQQQQATNNHRGRPLSFNQNKQHPMAPWQLHLFGILNLSPLRCSGRGEKPSRKDGALCLVCLPGGWNQGNRWILGWWRADARICTYSFEQKIGMNWHGERGGEWWWVLQLQRSSLRILVF